MALGAMSGGTSSRRKTSPGAGLRMGPGLWCSRSWWLCRAREQKNAYPALWLPRFEACIILGGGGVPLCRLINSWVHITFCGIRSMPGMEGTNIQEVCPCVLHTLCSVVMRESGAFRAMATSLLTCCRAPGEDNVVVSHGDVSNSHWENIRRK